MARVTARDRAAYYVRELGDLLSGDLRLNADDRRTVNGALESLVTGLTAEQCGVLAQALLRWSHKVHYAEKEG